MKWHQAVQEIQYGPILREFPVRRCSTYGWQIMKMPEYGKPTYELYHEGTDKVFGVYKTIKKAKDAALEFQQDMDAKDE